MLRSGRVASRQGAEHMLLRVKVKPRSRTSGLTPAADGSWVATLKSPPVDGKANAELVTLVASHFECPKAAVSIKSGAAARIKVIRVSLTVGKRVG
jgi:uncharacterized protein (TIGR00251 family)